MERTSFFLDAQGCALHVTACGDRKNAPVLVLLHGGPGSGAAPLMALPAFEELERRFNVVYFDQRGSGESVYDLSLGLPKEQLVEDVKTVVLWAKKQYPDRPAFLWGGSFGGLLGLLYLDRYQDTVDKAVISSPAILPAAVSGGQEMLKQVMCGLAEIAPEKYRSMLRGANEFEDLENNPLMAEFLSGLKAMPAGLEGGLHIYAMRKWFLSCDARPVLSGLRIPVRLLQGLEDSICPAQTLLDAFAACGNKSVTIKTYSPCGHAVFEDRLNEFVEELTSFFVQE